MTEPARRSAASDRYEDAGWVLPTLATARRGEPRGAARAGEPPAPDPRTGKVRCHCGRPEWPSHLIDLRDVPVQFRRWTQQDWACNACVEVMVAEGKCSRRRLYRMLGAPAPAIARIRAYAQARGERDDDDD